MEIDNISLVPLEIQTDYNKKEIIYEIEDVN